MGENDEPSALQLAAMEMIDIKVGNSCTGLSAALAYTRADRGGFAPREQLPLPTQPPYTAHLGNMSFDATQADVSNFFADCQVTNVRIVEDKLDHKPKGFGYVEFATLDGLKKALTCSGTQFQGRNIRVSVAEPRKLKHPLTSGSLLSSSANSQSCSRQ
jgi:translation initiation factor 4B